VRPAALRAGTPLLLLAAVPFGVLGAVAVAFPPWRWERYTGPWPRVHPGLTGYRVLGACLVLLAVVYLLLTVLAHGRRRWARTGVAGLTAVFDVVLVMVLLADPPRVGWLLFGAGVVLCSLAGLVLCYQPDVDRYLADHARHAA